MARKRKIEGEQGIVFVDLAQGTGKMSAVGYAVGSLFRRFSVEVFVVGLRIGAGMVGDAVPMIWWRIERVKHPPKLFIIDGETQYFPNQV